MAIQELNLATREKQDEIRTNVNTIKTDTAYIKNNLPPINNSVIKSIQRGVSTGVADGKSVSVPISQINPAKTVVLVDGPFASDLGTFAPPYLISISPTSFEVRSDFTGRSPGKFGWQVIELN